MTARCKVCKRELTNPAHIAMGMGPICAAKLAARGASVTDGGTTQTATRVYPVERYEMIVKGAQRLADTLSQATRNVVRARAQGTRDEQAAAQARYELTQHWYARVRRMEQRAYRLAYR